MITIIPSLASADPLDLKTHLDALGAVDRIHLDIEDGNFVSNITFGIKTVRAVAGYTSRQLDAHLMVTHPMDYLDDLLDAGVAAIAIHVESGMYPGECLAKIRSRGAKAGLAFNCMADVALALPYIDDLDYILIMTSEPDGRGQLFNPHMLEKIRHARALLPERIGIMVDGGINAERLPEVIQAGADTIVMGRAIWTGERPQENHRLLMELAEGGKA